MWSQRFPLPVSTSRARWLSGAAVGVLLVLSPASALATDLPAASPQAPESQTLVEHPSEPIKPAVPASPVGHHRTATGIDAELRAAAKIGLSSQDLPSPAQTPLQTDLWRGLAEADFREFLTLLDPTALPPQFAGLTHRILSVPPARSEGSDLAVWQDLEGLRILRLLDLGAAGEAARIYAEMAPENPPPLLLKAGALGFLATGQPSLACLEMKANGGELHLETLKTDDPFWENFESACQSLFDSESVSPPAAGPDAKFSPSVLPFGTLAALSPVKALMSLSDDQLPISFIDLSGESLPTLSPLVQTRLILRASTPPDVQLHLWASSQLDLPAPRPEAHDPIPTGTGPWARLAVLYRQTTLPLGPMDASVFQKEAAALSHDIPPRFAGRALTLLTPALAAMTPADDLSVDELTRLTAILLSTESPRAGGWISALKTRMGENPAHSIPASAVFLLGQIASFSEADGPLPLSFKALKEADSLDLAKTFLVFSEFLDKPPHFIDTSTGVYEKKEDLTKGFHYVMPMSRLRNHLTSAARNKQSGRLILSGLLTLQTPDPREIDPALLEVVLDGLVGAGLKAEARQIAAYILLGVILKGET